MCGIFGLVAGEGGGLDKVAFDRLLSQLFLQSESRGKEAAGAAFCSSNTIEVIRKALPASDLLKHDDYHQFRDRALSVLVTGEQRPPLAVIGHARLVTNGLQGIDSNNQPVIKGNVVCVHNGIIVNEPQLWLNNPDLKKSTDVDTEVVAAMLDRELTNGVSPELAARKVFGQVYGEASLAVLFAGSDDLLLLTNTGSIFVVHNRQLRSTFYCSELAIAKRILLVGGDGWKQCTIAQLRAGSATLINLSTGSPGAPFSLIEDHAVSASVSNQPAEIRQSIRRLSSSTDQTYQRLKKMRRCTRCILPETMPFINFDAQGVCNYCNNYSNHSLKGESELLRLLDGYRSRDGSPDCLVGFSGGRDSSYGLHLLKVKYGMNPIAYTYDWGMVTDLARRNQARLCGKLGVEHIWVSANIKAKRRNVRSNVEAWFRRPDLGMVPLFMAGDKQFMWHANRLMKETGLKLMVYSTNHFERTDFKTGFCGVVPKSSGLRLHKMSHFEKLRFLAYYIKNYATNPGYLNGSLADTFTAFLSYYFVNQDFLYLFDYIKWDENEINKILIKEYDWELAKDTTTTWRIGDGTAPFYNYIYQVVAGFSEYETFRSNQIREGVISREEALQLVETENRPRIDSIREYCGLIGIDFDIAMREIDNIPKLY